MARGHYRERHLPGLWTTVLPGRTQTGLLLYDLLQESSERTVQGVLPEKILGGEGGERAMNNFTGRLYRQTAFRNGGRKAGIGVNEDDYGDESFPGGRNPRPELARMPHDCEKPEDLNGPVIVVQAGKERKCNE